MDVYLGLDDAAVTAAILCTTHTHTHTHTHRGGGDGVGGKVVVVVVARAVHVQGWPRRPATHLESVFLEVSSVHGQMATEFV